MATMAPRRTLADQIDGPLPDGIAALDDENKQILADALRRARRHQAAALEAAAEDALAHVPFFLRGTVRKAAGL